MFLLSRAINRGNLRSAGISRFTAKPLRLHWSPSLASASFGRLLLRWSTILGYYRFDPQCFTKNLWVLPMLAWLLRCRCPTRCCLRPRGGRISLVCIAISVSLALTSTRSAHSQNSIFSGLRGRFRAFTLHLAGPANLLLIRQLASGWLTKPFPGGLQCPSQLRTRARFEPMFDVHLFSLPG
jgi:hypothetical protein